MLEHWLREFWRQGYSARVPGLPLAVLRILMGIFWFSQPVATGVPLTQRILFCLTGVLLAIGLLTKVGALLGALLTVWHVVQFAIPSGEALWPYGLLIVIHLLILDNEQRPQLRVDQLVVEKLANWPGKRSFWTKRLLALF